MTKPTIGTTTTEKKKFVAFDDASDDLKELEAWEVEFHARFGGSKFLPYIDPSRVREFIRELLEKANL